MFDIFLKKSNFCVFLIFSDPLDESSDDDDNTRTRFQTKSKFHSNEEEDEDNDDDDDDEEDDTAELMAELARIKKERAAEAARLEQLKRVEEEKIRTENILKGNPLLNSTSKQATSTEFRVKRRWDDDVVFKNCAKADGSSGEKRVAQFVNDSLRSDFHRRFMDKYIK
jgi:protein CWC15